MDYLPKDPAILVSSKNYLYIVKILLRREKRDLFDLSL